MSARPALLALAVAVALGACDVRDALPPGPTAVARAADDERAARLRDHLAALPAVAGASVVIDRAVVDPLARAPAPASPPTVAVAVVTRAGEPSAVAALDDVARTAARAVVGADARVSVAIVPAPPRPELARLGPFTVAAGARGPLLALIAGALAVIAVLAGALTVALARRRPT